jgi:hypothetical protein
VYWFKNGFSAADKPEIPNFFPSFGAGYGQHWCDGDDAPNFDNDPEFSYTSAADIVRDIGSHKTHQTQLCV